MSVVAGVALRTVGPRRGGQTPLDGAVSPSSLIPGLRVAEQFNPPEALSPQTQHETHGGLLYESIQPSLDAAGINTY